jgi:hypothetical protein
MFIPWDNGTSRESFLLLCKLIIKVACAREHGRNPFQTRDFFTQMVDETIHAVLMRLNPNSRI